MHHDEKQAKLDDLIKDNATVMFTTIDPHGAIVSRPMTVQEVRGSVLTFVTQADNDVARDGDAKTVNLTLADGGTYVSLSGTGRVEHDLAKKRELWNRINEAFAGDPEDPNNVIFEVTVDGGEYWDSGNAVAQLVGIAKAAVTGEAPTGKHGDVTP
ncbi:MAG: pyridoxamine 5'-phosphate oxidase family protein [Propionibacteriaceae bacterium]|nr:pyridoxamine 5'-phosphate oxidase family protein [Propionibacteriaceae bacterium]